MRQSRLVLLALALLGVSAGPGPVRADAGPATTPALGVSIDDFNYLDTSGEVTDQAAVHEKRLEEFMQVAVRTYVGFWGPPKGHSLEVFKRASVLPRLIVRHPARLRILEDLLDAAPGTLYEILRSRDTSASGR